MTAEALPLDVPVIDLERPLTEQRDLFFVLPEQVLLAVASKAVDMRREREATAFKFREASSVVAMLGYVAGKRLHGDLSNRDRGILQEVVGLSEEHIQYLRSL